METLNKKTIKLKSKLKASKQKILNLDKIIEEKDKKLAYFKNPGLFHNRL